MGDRTRQWLVGLGVILLFFSVFDSVYQTRQNGQQAAAFNAWAVRKDAQITTALHNGRSVIDSIQATQAEFKAIQQQDSAFIAEIHAEVPQLAAGLTVGQNTLIGQYNTVVAKLNAICAALRACGITPPSPTVQVPVAPRGPSAPTTTTTAPAHGKKRR